MPQITLEFNDEIQNKLDRLISGTTATTVVEVICHALATHELIYNLVALEGKMILAFDPALGPEVDGVELEFLNMK